MAYVYKISGNGLDYYGSSNQKEYKRISKHKSEYRTKKIMCASHKIFESYGDEWETGNWTFEKIKDFDTLQEAKEYENLCIINESCVNINRAVGLTDDEMRKYKAEWKTQKRRAEGVPIKKKYETDEERKETKKINDKKSKQQYLANMSIEEKEEYLKKNRDRRHTEEAREKEREYRNRPEVKERSRLQQKARRDKMV
jgi:hypothetical protein